ncbi:MAG TPA: ABC transporter ATP-binding protein [Synergistales bacterium]|nr:ABC transporter ATP-binding protein [Synergistales bacterium]
MRELLLSAKGVSVSFLSPRGTTEALKGVDMDVPTGGCVAVVGESGSGKTTLLRACLGLVPMFEGSVTLFDRDLSFCGSKELVTLRRRCGYVPQDPFGCVPPTLNTLDAAAEPVRITGKGNREQALEKARELLAELGLDDQDLWKERVRLSLSGVQRQRVSIARALSLDPELLLADEPASMQDAANRGEVMEILRRRTRKGMGLLMATHDLPFAAAFADRVVVMYKGTVVETGPPDQVVENPLHPYSLALISAMPGIGKGIRPPRPVEVKDRSFGGCPFAPMCPTRTERCRQAPSLTTAWPSRSVACWNVGKESLERLAR